MTISHTQVLHRSGQWVGSQAAEPRRSLILAVKPTPISKYFNG
jgi:hypothetical protein